MTVRSLAALLLVFCAALPARAVEVRRVVSPGGIKAWLVEDHRNPIIALEFAFRGGSALDPVGKEGLANMLSGLLDEGAGELDSRTFQAKLEDLSIRLSFESGMDRFHGSLRTLTENRDTAFDLLRLALSEPRFDSEPVERIRGQIQIGLKQRSEDPASIAGRALRRLLFPEHPYGRPSEGTRESVAALTPADLRGFVDRRFARDNLTVGAVGDITPEALAALLDKSFAGLPENAAPITVREVSAPETGGTVVIERPIPQSVVALGHGGIKRDDPDFYAAYVVNYILGGGGFSSRLYEEVREKRGLAYSVYSYLSPLDHAGLVLGGVATANAGVAESISLIKRQWTSIAEEGPTADELEAAKTYLTGSYPLRLTSSDRIASMLLGIQLEDLGIDYINARNGFIEAVTLEDARRVAARLYRPDALLTVVVGQPEGVEPTLEPPA